MKVYIAMSSSEFEGLKYIKACNSLQLAKLQIKNKCKDNGDTYSDVFDCDYCMQESPGNYSRYYIITEEI